MQRLHGETHFGGWGLFEGRQEASGPREVGNAMDEHEEEEETEENVQEREVPRTGVVGRQRAGKEEGKHEEFIMNNVVVGDIVPP